MKLNQNSAPPLLVRTVCLLSILVLALRPAPVRGQALVTFQFSGVARYQLFDAIPDISIGDQFVGYYTFNPLTPGTPSSPLDNTIDMHYQAVTAWSVSVPARGLTFAGSAGEISVGNDTDWYKSDRYLVDLFPDPARSTLPSGHTLTGFNIDLFRYGWGVESPLLQDSSIQVVPPDISLVLPGDGIGRFYFDTTTYQNWTQTLTVPEPSTSALVIFALAGWAFVMRGLKSRSAQRGKREGLPLLFRINAQQP